MLQLTQHATAYQALGTGVTDRSFAPCAPFGKQEGEDLKQRRASKCIAGNCQSRPGVTQALAS